MVREIWWLGNVGVSWDWVHVLCADLDWVAEATVVMVGVSSSFNNQARFGTGQKNKKFGLILDGDSGNGIMGFCAGSWMDGYSMTRFGLLFSIDTAFNGVGYALDGILAWIPMASGFGVSPLE